MHVKSVTNTEVLHSWLGTKVSSFCISFHKREVDFVLQTGAATVDDSVDDSSKY